MLSWLFLGSCERLEILSRLLLFGNTVRLDVLSYVYLDGMSSLLTVLVLLFSTVLLSFTFDLIRRADLLLRIFDSCSDIIWEPSCSIVWAESATLDLGRVDVINYIYVLRSLVIAGLFILVLRSILLCLLICFRNFWYDSSAGCKSAVMKSGGLTPGICCAVSNLLNAFL